MFSQSEHMIFLVRCHGVYMFQSYGCLTITPKLNGIEQPCTMLAESAGQELGQGSVRVACCACSAMSGSQREASEAGGRGLPKAH